MATTGTRVYTSARSDLDTFPATSIADVTTGFEPSESWRPQLNAFAFSVAAAPLQVTLARPESASDAVPLTLAGVLKRFAPSAGDVTLRSGGVLSSFALTEAVAESPALLTAVPLMTCPSVSALTTTGAGQTSMPLVL